MEQQTQQPRRRSENDYHFGRNLGVGSFSSVYLARELESRKEFASKWKNLIQLGHLWNFSHLWRHSRPTSHTQEIFMNGKFVCV